MNPTITAHLESHAQATNRSDGPGWPAVLLLVGLVLALAGPAWGAPIQVTTTDATHADECTLAEAIAIANAGQPTGGSDDCQWNGVGDPEIDLDAGTYETAGVLPFMIEANVTIQGESNTTTNLERDANSPLNRLFNVQDQAQLELSAVTVSGGGNVFKDAAIKVDQGGTLKLDYCRFDGIVATTGGGAVHSSGSLEIGSCTFAGNSAADGGAVYLRRGSAIIYNSTFIDNVAVDSVAIAKGGAIFVKGGAALAIESSTFSSNDAEKGGALAVYNGSALVDMSTFKDNVASPGSAILTESQGTVTLERSALAGTGLCDGTVTSGGNNAAEDSSCGYDPAQGDQVANLNLSDLVDNHGGVTPVHVPLCPWTGPDGECDSPLIEQYECRGQAESCDPAVWACEWNEELEKWEWPEGVEVTRDQRDQFPRKDNANPLGQGERCDIGAYESICSSGHESPGTYSIGLVGGQTDDSPGMVLNNGGCSSEDVGFGGQTSGCSIVWYRYGGTFEFKNIWFLRQSCLDQHFDGGRDCFSNPRGCKDTCAFNPGDAADFSAFTDENGAVELVRPQQSLPSNSYVIDVPGCTWSAPDGESTDNLRSVIELVGGVLDYWDPEIDPPNN